VVQASGQAGEPASVSYHVPCRFKYLALIRQTALEICQRVGLSEFQAYQVEMAVDEACTNVIEHSYGGESVTENESTENTILVNFFERADGVDVEIVDTGKGFDHDVQAVQDPKNYLANKNERGLGMYIIGTFVDSVHYERGTARGNVLRLTKRR
jgi:serine/threonine-protein kinase RsbW